jgi:hypothetical protein
VTSLKSDRVNLAIKLLSLTGGGAVQGPRKMPSFRLFFPDPDIDRFTRRFASTAGSQQKEGEHQ